MFYSLKAHACYFTLLYISQLEELLNLIFSHILHSQTYPSVAKARTHEYLYSLYRSPTAFSSACHDHTSSYYHHPKFFLYYPLIKCYSSSSPGSVEIPSNSIRFNFQKVCSWSRKPKTTLEIRKNATFLYVINSLLFTSFSKTLLTTERRLTGW